MKRFRITVSGETRGGRQWSYAVPGAWLAAPAVLLLLTAVLAFAGPWNRWPPQPPAGDARSEHVVPLYVRDPSALVMGPFTDKGDEPRLVAPAPEAR
jgi:hypothetical protein